LKFKGYKEIEFSNDNGDCTFDILLTLIKNTVDNDDEITVKEIKQLLIQKYSSIRDVNFEELVNLLHYYGYPQVKLFEKGEISIEDIIMSKDYYVNNFDILLVSNNYNIPIVLVNAKTFVDNNSSYLSLNVNENEKKCYVIRTPNFYKYKMNVPKYRLFIDKHNNCLLDINKFPEVSIQNEILKQNNNLKNLLEKYTILRNEDSDVDDNSKKNSETIKKTKLKGKKLKLVENPNNI